MSKVTGKTTKNSKLSIGEQIEKEYNYFNKYLRTYKKNKFKKDLEALDERLQEIQKMMDNLSTIDYKQKETKDLSNISRSIDEKVKQIDKYAYSTVSEAKATIMIEAAYMLRTTNGFITHEIDNRKRKPLTVLSASGEPVVPDVHEFSISKELIDKNF